MINELDRILPWVNNLNYLEWSQEAPQDLLFQDGSRRLFFARSCAHATFRQVLEVSLLIRI